MLGTNLLVTVDASAPWIKFTPTADTNTEEPVMSRVASDMTPATPEPTVATPPVATSPVAAPPPEPTSAASDATTAEWETTTVAWNKTTAAWNTYPGSRNTTTILMNKRIAMPTANE